MPEDRSREPERAPPVLPGDTPPGDYRLVMRVEHDGQPVPWGRGWLPGGSELSLGWVSVGN